MRLSTTDDTGLWEPRTDNVYFTMMYSGHRIRCGVTGLAIVGLEPMAGRTAKERLAGFGRHRSIIARLAGVRFDDKKWEADGITILVSADDVQNDRRSST
jgi:hypothetical protein